MQYWGPSEVTMRSNWDFNKWSGHHTVWFILYVANTGFLPIGDDFEVNFKWLESIKILIFYQIIIMIFNEYIKLILWFISESWFEPIIHSKLRIFAEIFNFWTNFGHCRPETGRFKPILRPLRSLSTLFSWWYQRLSWPQTQWYHFAIR